MAKYLIAGALLTAIVVFAFISAPGANAPDTAAPVIEAASCDGGACESERVSSLVPSPSRPKVAEKRPPLAAVSDADTETGPKGDARIQQALELFHEGRKDAAIQMLEELIRSEPSNSMALTELGQLYALNPNEMERAVQLFKTALDADPENLGAVEELARVEKIKRGAASAEQTLGDAAGKYPDSAAIAGTYGTALVERGRFDKALPHLQRAAREPNASLEVQAALAHAYGRQGDARGQAETLGKLISAQESFIARHGSDPEVVQGMRRDIATNSVAWARALVQARDFDKAEAVLRAADKKHASTHDLEGVYQELQRAKRGG